MLAGDRVGDVPREAGQPPILADFRDLAQRLKIELDRIRGEGVQPGPVPAGGPPRDKQAFLPITVHGDLVERRCAGRILWRDGPGADPGGLAISLVAGMRGGAHRAVALWVECRGGCRGVLVMLRRNRIAGTGKAGEKRWSCCSSGAHGLAPPCVGGQGTLHRIQLPAQFPQPLQQLQLFPLIMRHRPSPSLDYTHLGYSMYPVGV